VASLKDNLVKYIGTYQDSNGIEEVTIINNFKNISFRLGEFNFVGRYFDDFELIGYDNFTLEQLKRFTFRTVNIYKSERIGFELINFILTFSIPITILNLETKQLIPTSLLIKLNINSKDNDTKIILKLIYNDMEYSGTSSLFEGAAQQINEQIKGEFTIKNCFWCLYSDYSVYGQGLAGSMLCFLKFKDQYLKVKNKDDYMEMPTDVPLIQEIYSCDSFETRKPGTGYRG
jgi:hypothetical protein